MKYQTIYNNLIESRKLFNRKKYQGEYFERHHIVPKCLDGTNEKSNLILLTAKEHFIAHLLLCKIYENTKFYYKLHTALWRMINTKDPNRFIVGAKTYEEVRCEIMKKYTGIGNPNYGKRWNKEQREHLSNVRIGNYPSWNTGLTKDTNDGLKIVSEKMSLFRKGKKTGPFSKDHSLHISQALKGIAQPKFICRICGKEVGGLVNLTRWHNENCKKIKIRNPSPSKGKILSPKSDEAKQKQSNIMIEYWKNNVHPRKGNPPWNKTKNIHNLHALSPAKLATNASGLGRGV